MKTSLSSFLYLHHPLAEAVRRTAAAGFDGIDIWGGRPHAYRTDLSEGEIREVRRVIEGEGLGVASFIPAQFRYPSLLCSNSERIRQDSVQYIQCSIETAAALKAPVVSVCPGHSLSGQGVADAWQRLAESLGAICEFAEPYNIRIAIEPADHYETDLILTTGDARKMLSELGYDNLGVVLDTGHAQVVNESAIAAVATLGSRLFHVHVDDNDGRRDQHLVPGDGVFAFPSFLGALEAAGYDRYLAAELSWDYTIDPDPAASLAAGRLAELLQTVRRNQ